HGTTLPTLRYRVAPPRLLGSAAREEATSVPACRSGVPAVPDQRDPWRGTASPGGCGMDVRIRLIATDLDGTLLADPTSISPRNLAALDAARAFGMEVVPVTARQPPGLLPVAEMCGFTSWALCGNGTQAIHLNSGESLFAAEL